MKTILILIAALLAPIVHAGGFTTGLQTYHVSNDEELNEVNTFIGISNDRFHASTFINSYNERSVSIGIHQRWDIQRFEISVLVGGVYGYDPENFKEDIPCAGDVCPYVAVGAAYMLTPDVALDVVVFGDAMMYGVRYMW